MEGQKPPEFVFMVQAQPGVIGPGRWHFQLIDDGIPKELIHAFMRHYLQDDEEKYHEFFTETYLGNGKKRVEEEWTYREWVVPRNLDSRLLSAPRPVTKEQKAWFTRIDKWFKEAKLKKNQERRSFWP